MTHTFSLYAFVTLVWFMYRLTTHNAEIIDETIAKPLIWLIPLLVIYQYKKISLKSFALKSISLKLFILSFIAGLGLALLQIIPNVLKGYTQPHIPSNLPLLILATACTAFTEELFFRSFLLQQLSENFEPIIANFLSSFLFAGIHVPLLLFSGGPIVIALYAVLISGLVFGALFLFTKNAIYSMIAHFTLNILLLVY